MGAANRIRVAVFLLVCMAFLSAVFAVQGALLSSMIDAYGLKASNQGTANAMAFAGGIAALVTAFFLQGRRRKRALLKAATGLTAASLALLWLAPGYGAYCAVWFVTGYGMGLMDTLLSACMADLYSGDRAAMMMCLLHTAFGLASVLTPMGYQSLLAGGMHWKRIYLLIAVGGALLLVAAAIGRRAWRIGDDEPLNAKAVSLGDIAEGVSRGRLALLVASMLFHGIYLAGLNTWINRYADTLPGRFSLPAQSCLFFGIMLSRLLMPFLPIRPDRYVRLGGLLGSAALAVGLCFPSGMALRIALAVTGLLAGALIPCILSLGCDRLRENTLLATTATVLALYVGQAVSSPMVATLQSAFSLRVGIALCVVCLALCSGCCLLDAATRRRA